VIGKSPVEHRPESDGLFSVTSPAPPMKLDFAADFTSTDTFLTR